MIEFENITYHYGRTLALDQLNLRLEPGLHGLLGQNGAGKTTLLRILATLHYPKQGSVRIMGLDPKKHDERLELRRILGYLPQEFTPYPQFSAFEFVEYIAILKGMRDSPQRRARVMAVLASVGLESVIHQKTGSFSGGMRRRLGIAQALVNQPQLLVVDEPTAGLDPAERVRFRHLLASTSAVHTLISTHIVEDVTAVAPQVSVLHKGKFIYQGKPQALAQCAQNRVFLSDQAVGMVVSSGEDGHRVLLDTPPSHGQALDPTIEEGYLSLIGAHTPAVAQALQVPTKPAPPSRPGAR
jgi:ABC-2 type transport system ATP-binding protein